MLRMLRRISKSWIDSGSLHLQTRVKDWAETRSMIFVIFHSFSGIQGLIAEGVEESEQAESWTGELGQEAWDEGDDSWWQADQQGQHSTAAPSVAG